MTGLFPFVIDFRKSNPPLIREFSISSTRFAWVDRRASAQNEVADDLRTPQGQAAKNDCIIHLMFSTIKFTSPPELPAGTFRRTKRGQGPQGQLPLLRSIPRSDAIGGTGQQRRITQCGKRSLTTLMCRIVSCTGCCQGITCCVLHPRAIFHDSLCAPSWRSTWPVAQAVAPFRRCRSPGLWLCRRQC